MDEIIQALTFLLICGFAAFDGWIDAYHWHIKWSSGANNEIERDTHPLRLARRVIVCALAVMFLTYTFEPIWAFSGICFALVFNFFHNGAMYLNRNRLNRSIYKDKWFAQSDTTQETRFFTDLFKPVNRTVFFGIGVIFYIILIIF